MGHYKPAVNTIGSLSTLLPLAMPALGSEIAKIRPFTTLATNIESSDTMVALPDYVIESKYIPENGTFLQVSSDSNDVRVNLSLTNKFTAGNILVLAAINDINYFSTVPDSNEEWSTALDNLRSRVNQVMYRLCDNFVSALTPRMSIGAYTIGHSIICVSSGIIRRDQDLNFVQNSVIPSDMRFVSVVNPQIRIQQ